MAPQKMEEERVPLTTQASERPSFDSRYSIDSTSSVSTTLPFHDVNGGARGQIDDDQGQFDKYRDHDLDIEEGDYTVPDGKPVDRKTRRIFFIVGFICVAGWLLAFFVFLFQGHSNDDSAAASIGTDVEEANLPPKLSSSDPHKPVTLDQVLTGAWYANSRSISWIAGPQGEDGLLLKQGGRSKEGYLRVDDIRGHGEGDHAFESRVLMQGSYFSWEGRMIMPSKVWPSPDQKTVLVLSDDHKNWRYSFTGKYWLFDVETQKGQPLDHDLPDARIQLASWSPQSDAVVFTRDNNMFLRSLSSTTVKQITTDGGPNYFYGIPDWVYEEEVIAGNSVTWWADDGQHIVYLRTNESAVPEFPVQYFLSRPSGERPPEGEENYPEVREIKYPKAGAPNPTVDLQFYDVVKGETFTVDIAGRFPDDDRITIEVIPASEGKWIVRESNRESDIVTIAVIDTSTRTGKIVRKDDIAGLDGGWVEPSQTTRYIPANPSQGRLHDGYIDTIIHNGYDHLALFSPVDNPEPVLLTSGEWEVVDAPSAVDLQRGLVYFVATKESPTQRHVYSVKLDGTDLQSVTDTSNVGYYSASFSEGAGYLLLSYKGPSIPWQKVMNTPSNDDIYEETLETNEGLAAKAKEYALPTKVFSTVNIDGFTLQTVERRPPHFDPKKRYPVLFYLYGGPGSQQVDRTFKVDFQSYVASSLGYIVVTVDGRGTGFIGRKARAIIRGNIGHYESRDQIETAKIWARKPYVDESRMAIWGWSYGGFMTLKTLEQDAGATFRYGMAVAPVTDWQFYDSVYTERYMHTPQHNPDGYKNATVSDVNAISNNTRFLVMHGSADDNVHFQNTLVFLDRLDEASISNYDVHVFPDSDHNIFFNNANFMVYGRLSDWLINAFNGEWLKIGSPKPKESIWRRALRLVSDSS